MTIKKRFFTRHPIALRVRVRTATGWVDMESLDISRRGVFIRTDQPIAMGRIAQLRLTMPGGIELDAMGHVRRVVTDGPEQLRGMGIEFFVMSKEAEDAWDHFVLDQSRRMVSDTSEVVVEQDAPPGLRSVAEISRELILDLPLARETIDAPLPQSRRVSRIVNEPTEIAENGGARGGRTAAAAEVAASLNPGPMAPLIPVASQASEPAEPARAKLAAASPNLARPRLDERSLFVSDVMAETLTATPSDLGPPDGGPHDAAGPRGGAMDDSIGDEDLPWAPMASPPPLPIDELDPFDGRGIATDDRSAGTRAESGATPPPLPDDLDLGRGDDLDADGYDEEGEEAAAIGRNVLASTFDARHRRPGEQVRDPPPLVIRRIDSGGVEQLQVAPQGRPVAVQGAAAAVAAAPAAKRTPNAGEAASAGGLTDHGSLTGSASATSVAEPFGGARAAATAVQEGKVAAPGTAADQPSAPSSAAPWADSRSAPASKPAPAPVAAPARAQAALAPEATAAPQAAKPARMAPTAAATRVASPARTAGAKTAAPPPATGASVRPSGPADMGAPVRAALPRDPVRTHEESGGLFITVRPGDVGHLRQFIDRRIRQAGVFLRSSVDCRPGQTVDVAVVHPDTDAEIIVSGTVARVIRGESESESGFLLRFEEIDEQLRASLIHFVETGHPEVLAPTAMANDAVAKKKQEALDQQERPAAWLAYAWTLLAESDNAAEAVEAFQRALMLDPEQVEIHRGLALAYALAGDHAKAFAFVRSAHQLEQVIAR